MPSTAAATPASSSMTRANTPDMSAIAKYAPVAAEIQPTTTSTALGRTRASDAPVPISAQRAVEARVQGTKSGAGAWEAA